jgi:hypothetical protein
MSLDFDKVNAKRYESDIFWTSYADLYTMMSAVFLLLYVTASLRAGTSAVQNQMETKRLKAEAADLKEQNKVYNTLKDDYLEKSASEEEQKVYKELMKKLTLLQDDARKEKEDLRQQALENEKKEMALNKYQQIVRNIINANMLAKSGMKTRDEVIATKKQKIASLDQELVEKKQTIAQDEQTLAQQADVLKQQDQEIKEKKEQLSQRSAEVESLKTQVAEKKQIIADNSAKIDSLNTTLADQIAELKETQKREKTSKKAMQEQIAALEQETQGKIAALEQKNDETENSLKGVASALSNAKGQLAEAQGALGKSNAEKDKLAGELEATKGRLQGEIAGLKDAFGKEMAGKEKAFKDALAKEKLSGDERAAKEKAFADAAAKRAKELGDQIGGLEGKIKEADQKLAEAAGAEKKYKNYIASLEKEKDDLSEDLKKSRAQLRDQKALAKAIGDAFKNAGIPAKVDPNSGDVTINFDEYFDTGHAELKPGMKTSLKRLIPIYSASLFKDPKIAEKLAAIDIVGFASPTYKGKFVDPESLASEDREAVTYNLDLSYNRAKSIFNYIFDTRTMTYKHQRDLLPIVKVTGRSYLHEAVKGLDAESGVSVKQFCAKYDCNKEQKVVIKFHLKD